MSKKKIDRRNLLFGSIAGATVAAATGATASANESSPHGSPQHGAQRSPTLPPRSYLDREGFRAAPIDEVRIGFVGTGLQGGGHVRNFLGIEGVSVRAICDVDRARAEEVASWVAKVGQPAPELYTRGPEDWRRLCERPDIDLVFNATPWEWHVPVCTAAMEAGKHTAVEVPAAITLDGCWELVETAERTERHCVMMENCNYGQRELMILRMCRMGMLGELLHAEGAYIHDLRGIKFGATNEGLWRWRHSVERNANLYPTHGLGPVAQCLDINRGDAFDYLVSMSSPARGIEAWVEEHLPESDPRRHYHYALGDMNSSLIRTRRGRTILLQHDTTTPRPYSRINLVQGTKGTVTGYPDRAFLEDRSPDGHRWQDLETLQREFEHPLWKEHGAGAAGAGHGGMDYLEDLRLIQALREGRPTDMDVYDAAALSVPVALSETSVRERSRPVDFPDFTRGLWRKRVPIPLGNGI